MEPGMSNASATTTDYVQAPENDNVTGSQSRLFHHEADLEQQPPRQRFDSSTHTNLRFRSDEYLRSLPWPKDRLNHIEKCLASRRQALNSIYYVVPFLVFVLLSHYLLYIDSWPAILAKIWLGITLASIIFGPGVLVQFWVQDQHLQQEMMWLHTTLGELPDDDNASF